MIQPADRTVSRGTQLFNHRPLLLQPYHGRVPVGYYFNNAYDERMAQVVDEDYEVFGFSDADRSYFDWRTGYKDVLKESLLIGRTESINTHSYRREFTQYVQTISGRYAFIPGGLLQLQPTFKLMVIGWQWRHEIIGSDFRMHTLHLWMNEDGYYAKKGSHKSWMREIVKDVVNDNVDVQIRLVSNKMMSNFVWSVERELPGFNVNELKASVLNSMVEGFTGQT